MRFLLHSLLLSCIYSIPLSGVEDDGVLLLLLLLLLKLTQQELFNALLIDPSPILFHSLFFLFVYILFE